MSPSLPALRFTFKSLSTRNKGTKFKVCAVLGLPSSLIMKSALPWSAVTSRVYPCARPAVTTLFTQASTVSTAFMAASKMPVWPTISAFA